MTAGEDVDATGDATAAGPAASSKGFERTMGEVTAEGLDDAPATSAAEVAIDAADETMGAAAELPSLRAVRFEAMGPEIRKEARLTGRTSSQAHRLRRASQA